MEANNSEVSTEQAVETNQETATDTSSTTNVSSIEAGDTAAGEQSSSEVRTTQTESQDEPIYLIGDREITVSRLKDLESSEFRQSDYTKKSQIAAESKKDLDAKHVLADENTKRLSETIDKLEASIKAEIDSEEMEELRVHDTAEYIKRKEELTANSKLAADARKDLDAKQTVENQERAVVERQLLIDSQPTWSDPKQMEADITLVESFIGKLELNDNDFNSLGSHKLMNLALSAAKYDALQTDAEAIEKEIQKAPNVIKATVKQSKTETQSRADRFYGKKKA